LALPHDLEVAHVFPDLSPLVEVELNGNRIAFGVGDVVDAFERRSLFPGRSFFHWIVPSERGAPVRRCSPATTALQQRDGIEVIPINREVLNQMFTDLVEPLLLESVAGSGGSTRFTGERGTSREPSPSPSPGPVL
jgi:hypothetical protein